MWLEATLVINPPGRLEPLSTCSPVLITANALVVGIPNACIDSLNKYSLKTGPSADLPSPLLENGVGPDPLS